MQPMKEHLQLLRDLEEDPIVIKNVEFIMVLRNRLKITYVAIDSTIFDFKCFIAFVREISWMERLRSSSGNQS
jgi:hypothetical protein